MLAISSQRRRVQRMALALTLAMVLSAAVGLASAEAGVQTPPDPIGLTGREWSRFSADERNAYLVGFLAGAAAQQASAARTPPGTGREIVARAALLKRQGRLTFPYRENVYRSHLDDYFFYQNRRSETLIQVLADLPTGAGHGR